MGLRKRSSNIPSILSLSAEVTLVGGEDKGQLVEPAVSQKEMRSFMASLTNI